MADLDKALATQLANIQQRTGKTLAELAEVVTSSGLSKHGELVAMLKSTLGMGHGDANTLVHTVRKGGADRPVAAAPSAGPANSTTRATPPASTDGVLDVLYVGPKAALRPIHVKLLHAMRTFGGFEEAPKKSYVSYRRKKQFTMIGPATNTRVEVGLNVRGLPVSERLQPLPAGQMCNYKVKLTDQEGVDAELIGWIRAAYDAAG